MCRRTRRLQFECLERRDMLSADGLPANVDSPSAASLAVEVASDSAAAADNVQRNKDGSVKLDKDGNVKLKKVDKERLNEEATGDEERDERKDRHDCERHQKRREKQERKERLKEARRQKDKVKIKDAKKDKRGNDSPNDPCNDEPAGPNQAPVAGDDDRSTDEDVALTIDIAGLLANDQTGPTPEPGQTLSLQSFEALSTFGGRIQDNGDGTLTYTPPTDFNGLDMFNYVAVDDGLTDGVADPLTDTAKVNIQVGAVNDAPIGQDDTATATQNTPLLINTADLLVNDSPGPANEQSQTVRVVGVESPSAQGGTVTFNPAGIITYLPPANYAGPDSFRYVVRDDGPVDSTGEAPTGTPTVNVEVRLPAST